MLVFVEDRIQEAQIPEIWETEEEKALSIDGLRRFYKEYARQNFRNHSYTNKDTGWKIRVSDQGIGEFRKFRKREHIILIRILDTMLEDSALQETVPDNKNSPGVENVSYFEYMCHVNGKTHTVKITVKKARNDEERIYYYYKFADMELK
jgi:hypothetical protein